MLVAAGAVSNGVTIALNDGTLPATASALAAAHIHKNPAVFLNSGSVAHPVLGFLGDVFAWPAPLPFANTFSLGDVLIVAGVAYGAHRIGGSRLGRLLDRRRPATPSPDGEATEAGAAAAPAAAAAGTADPSGSAEPVPCSPGRAPQASAVGRPDART